MTETMTRDASYILQGAMYFYRDKNIYCRISTPLRDAVDPALLQQAVDAALAEADYFKTKLVQEKREVYLAPNDQPFTVCRDSRLRAMPEETAGYLFNVSCEDRELFFDWFHFIADGHGVSRFLTRILMEYCNRRYGTALPARPWPRPPPTICRPCWPTTPPQMPRACPRSSRWRWRKASCGAAWSVWTNRVWWMRPCAARSSRSAPCSGCSAWPSSPSSAGTR